MGKNINRILKLANKVSKAAEQKIKKEINALVKSGLLTRPEARRLATSAIREANKERKRVQAFIKKELKKELSKAKPKIKKALARKKKQFASYKKKRR